MLDRFWMRYRTKRERPWTSRFWVVRKAKCVPPLGALLREANVLIFKNLIIWKPWQSGRPWPKNERQHHGRLLLLLLWRWWWWWWWWWWWVNTGKCHPWRGFLYCLLYKSSDWPSVLVLVWSVCACRSFFVAVTAE